MGRFNGDRGRKARQIAAEPDYKRCFNLIRLVVPPVYVCKHLSHTCIGKEVRKLGKE